MYNEIERKFLIVDMPKISSISPVFSDRYFLQGGGLIEERVQKKRGVFEYEMKVAISPREWRRDKTKITKEEFEELAKKSKYYLSVESYQLTKKSPRISIKEYKGNYRGLILAEVEFDSISEEEILNPLNGWG